MTKRKRSSKNSKQAKERQERAKKLRSLLLPPNAKINQVDLEQLVQERASSTTKDS